MKICPADLFTKAFGTSATASKVAANCMTATRLKVGAAASGVLLAASCSNQAAYDNLQRQAIKDCLEDRAATIQSCNEQYGKAFNEYTREREETLEQK